MPQSNRDIGSVYHAFVSEILRATTSLFHLLAGMRFVRQRNVSLPLGTICVAELPQLAVSTGVSQSEVDRLLGTEGRAEQLAFKGWVEEVFQLWEAEYRNELQRVLSPEATRPSSDPLGDLRLIRNDLVHAGKATAAGSGSARRSSGLPQANLWFCASATSSIC